MPAKQNKRQSKTSVTYYIEGMIDSIELTIGTNEACNFKLLPSSEFLKTMPNGEKKALFIEKTGRSAFLIDLSEEKGVLEFEIAKRNPALKCLLLEAKNNRNAVRVSANATGEASEEQKIDFKKPVAITIL